MIARGFKPVAWVAAVGTAALGCYMLSLQVAAERSELAKIERRIVAAQQSIRSLQTELGTRGRLQQLEQWNSEVLALSAPVANQFLDSNVSLARFDVRQPAFDPQADVRLASADRSTAAPAATPAASPPSAPVRLASASAPAAPRTARADQDQPLQPMLRRASLVTPAASSSPLASSRQRPPALLEESTLRDLRSAARSEGDEGQAN